MDNCYYEKVGDKTTCINDEIPFDIPNNWTWIRLCNVGIWKAGSTPLRSNPKYYGGKIAWLKTGELNEGTIVETEETVTDLALEECSLHLNPIGAVLIAMYGATIGKLGIAGIELCTNQACCACVTNDLIVNQYLFFYLKAIKSQLISKSAGGAQPNISREILINTLIALPPKKEQYEIIKQLEVLLDKTNKISQQYDEIGKLLYILRAKILEDIFGENSRYKSYYENSYLLGDILEYEQPAKYIVESTEYSDDYSIPVLTPGKTFILGFTNEKDGIYRVNGGSVIIFDDFTTASRIVDFDFKVKSSAMKILTVSDAKMFNIEYLYYLLQTIKVNNNTHKRYWISEFATKELFVHTIEQQKEIVNSIKSTFALLDTMSNSI